MIMNKCSILYLTKISLLACLLAGNSNATFIEGFPSQCSLASTNVPLVGHILRLGFMQLTPYGWVFSFPDVQNTQYLSNVPIADNVGLIGQDPYADFSQAIFSETPEGTVALAQIFVAADGVEPIVTCVSELISLNTYMPGNYGADLSWLNRDRLGYWFGRRNFGRNWDWQNRWGREFGEIRRKHRWFNERNPDRRFGRRIDRDEYRRQRDENDRRRPRNQEPSGRRGWRTQENRDRIDSQRPRDRQKPQDLGRPQDTPNRHDVRRPRDIPNRHDVRRPQDRANRPSPIRPQAQGPENIQKPQDTQRRRQDNRNPNLQRAQDIQKLPAQRPKDEGTPLNPSKKNLRKRPDNTQKISG